MDTRLVEPRRGHDMRDDGRRYTCEMNFFPLLFCTPLSVLFIGNCGCTQFELEAGGYSVLIF
jgi:hypothetical protein